MAAYWAYAPWAANTLAVLGAWRYVPLTVIRLVAAFTRDEQHHQRVILDDGVRAPPCAPGGHAARAKGERFRRRGALLEQLSAARQIVAAGGLGYLGALAGEVDGRTRLVLLGIAAAPFEVPDGIRPTSLLAALLRHHYPGANVEEFPTAHGEGVGIRRSGELPLPGRVPDTEPLTIDTGISQGLVLFPEAGLLGTVTGFCFGPDDIDVATVFTATIAHRMTVVRARLGSRSNSPTTKPSRT